MQQRALRVVLVGLLWVIAVGLFGTSAWGQQYQYQDQGLAPYGTFNGSPIDSVNLFNGKLNLHIPLISYPQRGGKLHAGFFVSYFNPTFSRSKDCIGIPVKCITTWDTDGLGVEIKPDFVVLAGNVNTTTDPRYQVVTPFATVHQMAATADGILSLDATGYHYNASAYQLIDRRGIRYSYNAAMLDAPEGDIGLGEGMLTRIEDPNGNLITTNYNGNGVATGWKDTLGRSLPMPPNALGSGNVTLTSDYSHCTGPLATVAAYLWNLPGVNGGNATFKVCVANVQVVYPSASCGPNCLPVNGPVKMIQSIVLPNLTAWTFVYANNGAGDLTEVIYPTGGSVSYNWVQVGYANSCTAPPNTYYRSITARSVDSGDGSGSHEWSYSGTTNNMGATSGNDVITVTDPDGNQTVHTLGQVVAESCAYYEIERQYYQDNSGSQTLLKTITTSYQGAASPVSAAPAINIAPVTIKTTWSNGQVREVDKSYDSGTQITGTSTNAIYGLVTEEDDYDYGSGARGALLRRTNTAYEALSNSQYLANNLLTLPYSVTVYDGSGTEKSSTVYGYDGASLVGAGIGTQHDSAPPDGSVRGNQTSVARWVSSSAGYLTTSRVFYDTGMVQKTLTPAQRPTTYLYSSTYAGAYPTQAADPIGLITKYTYDLNSGQVASRTDPSNQTTTYSYDSMWRLHTVSYPDGSSVSYNFYESSAPFTETITDETRVTTVTFDGLGRRAEQQVDRPSGGCSPITTKWTYDVLGNMASVTNPYCSTSDATYGVTSYTYDPLHRLLTTTRPDGNSTSNSYTGSATETTDEGNGTARVEHIYKDDGLGRLAVVCEVTSAQQMGTSGTPAACNLPISATGFSTTYAHDALGNLTAVYQNGLQTRSFQYDGLSRLTSATNPETGTITYTYDADSNVATRKDARSITTTYTYNADDQVLTKSYSDGTPEEEYTYCATASCSEWGDSLLHAAGRLVLARSVGAGGTGLGDTIFSYDPMGRIINEWECTPINCGTGNFALAYTYDSLGDLTSETNGEGIKISYSYDPIGELAGVTSSFQDSNHPGTLLTNVVRNAIGEATSDQLGNGIKETFNYDHRTRLTSSSAGSAYSLSIGYAPDGDVTSANDSVNGDWTFAYDGFNRLATSNKNSGQLSYTYAYDRYGNMWHGDGGLSVSFSGGNNRVDGHTYDASGNLLNDGAHSYTYDAEDRITKVDGGSTATYTYDALGHRVLKATPSDSMNYIYDQSGHEVAEVHGSQTGWYRGDVYAAGRHLATYVNSTTYFIQGDWLGTERARTGVTGSVVETCQSLPYGDGQSCSGSDVSPLHFTGKMRDTESNLDNFGARYYTSTMGRWMTPDWSARGDAVPYATLTNPQSLNLYVYVRDNPTTLTDPDGHAAWPGEIASFFRDLACSMKNFSCSGQSRQSSQVAADQTKEPGAQRPLSWSSLSAGQQALVSGGEKAWNGMSLDARANFAGITNVLGKESLLSELQSASMRSDGREVNVVWKAGAEKAFEKAGYHVVGDPMHHGTSLHQAGNTVEGLHAVFPSSLGNESQVHIDYRGGLAHFGTRNDDVLYNEEEYKKWYGPLPGLIP